MADRESTGSTSTEPDALDRLKTNFFNCFRDEYPPEDVVSACADVLAEQVCDHPCVHLNCVARREDAASLYRVVDWAKGLHK